MTVTHANDINRPNQPLLSICVPVYYEEENIPLLYQAIVDVVGPAGVTTEIVLVDDGSKDGSWAAIESLVKMQIPRGTLPEGALDDASDTPASSGSGRSGSSRGGSGRGDSGRGESGRGEQGRTSGGRSSSGRSRSPWANASGRWTPSRASAAKSSR